MVVTTKANSTSQRKRNTPKPHWALDHFTESITSFQNLVDIIQLSERGICSRRGMPDFVIALAAIKQCHVEFDGADPEDPLETQRKITQAEKEAALAQREIEQEFPVLHGFAVIALWGLLEHFVKRFIALWLMHRRDAIDCPVLKKVRVKIGDYLLMQKAEQADFLVEMLEQEVASSLKRGANRFLALLEPFGLSAPLAESCSKNLFELQQVRNILAHRNGKVDNKLRKDCPWLKLKLNQPLCVTGEMLERYQTATMDFVLATLYHFGDLYGFKFRPKPPDAIISS